MINSVFLDTIEVDFAQPTSLFSIWYTTFDPLEITLFDTDSNILGTLTGTPNTDGTFGASDFLQFASSGFDIARVTLQSTPGFFVLDDLTYEASPVPEPSTLALLSGGLGLLLGGAVRRFRARRGAVKQEL